MTDKELLQNAFCPKCHNTPQICRCSHEVKKEWVGLTDEDFKDVERWIEFKEEGSGSIPPIKLILYIEAKLKEKNT